jgi:hypothetical protein
MNPGIRIIFLLSVNGLSEAGLAGRGQDNVFSLSLKANKPHVGQRHKGVERNWEYFHIIIFPEWT